MVKTTNQGENKRYTGRKFTGDIKRFIEGMRSLQICMAIDYYYPMMGGSEIQAYRLSERLSQMGLKAFVVTRKYPGIIEAKIHNRARIYRLPILGSKKMASCVFLVRILYFLIRHRTKYDIIHCHLATSTALGCLIAGMITKTPVLIKLGGSGKTGDMQSSLSTHYGRLKINLLKKGPCNFVVPSQEIAQEMIETGFSTERIKVIPNGVDTDYFSPINSREKKIKKRKFGLVDKNLALYIGRFEPNKDIFLLIDAWSKLSERKKNWKLWIIGSGKLEMAIKNRILGKGLDHWISLISNVSPEKVKNYLQIGDLFIQPSRFEGLSNALLEAMSCGLPIIASKIKVNQGLIKDFFNGLLFDPRDTRDLVRCLERALEDDKDRESWGINGRKWIVENLDLSHVAMLYTQLYQEILSKSV
jgi:glycosyltransferase involved in cell wall biosynthesis